MCTAGRARVVTHTKNLERAVMQKSACETVFYEACGGASRKSFFLSFLLFFQLIHVN